MIEPKNITMSAGTRGKSLKEQNRWQLWLVIAFNSVFLYGVVQANAIKVEGLRGALADVNNLLPVAFALVVATVLNGVLSADAKARLVFLRWNNALPGCRAFSQYADSDPRIDPVALAKIQGSAFPADPVDQNRTWYRIYKTVEKDPAVVQVHRDFLLLRDYTGFSALLVVFYGAAGLYAISATGVRVIYLLLLFLQYAVVRQAASNYGIRMVTTVLALRAAAKEKPTRAARTPKASPQMRKTKASGISATKETPTE